MVAIGEPNMRRGSVSASPTLRAPRSTPRTLPIYCPPLYVLPARLKSSLITLSVMSISMIR